MWLKTKTYSNIKLQKYWNPKLILDTIKNKNKQLIWVIKLVCKCFLLFIVYSCEYICKLQSHIMLPLYRKNNIFSRIQVVNILNIHLKSRLKLTIFFLELKCNFCFIHYFIYCMCQLYIQMLITNIVSAIICICLIFSERKWVFVVCQIQVWIRTLGDFNELL